MNWANPKALYALLIIPVFIAILFFFKRNREKQMLRFCDKNLLSFHNKNFSNFYFNLKTFLLVLVYTFAVIALARPQWDKEIRIVETMGQDIVFLVDVSLSMDATDNTNQTRLERAKTLISLFLEELQDDRVAIVAFANKAAVICPLTTDYAAIRLLSNNLSTEYTITDYGTDIGEGLQRAAELFDTDKSAKTIILLSDGEDLAKSGVKQAQLLATQGITIYSLGIGSPEGSMLPLKNQRGQIEYAKDDKGEFVITYLDEVALRSLAEITDGRYYLVPPSYDVIHEILENIKHNEKSKSSSREYPIYKDQYRIFLILALILLVLEGFINYKKKEEM